MTAPATMSDLRDRAEEVAALLKTLSHPNRLLIICDLIESERSVGDIEDRTGVRQPGLSRELARLRNDGLVSTRRESKVVFYRVADRRLSRLVPALCAAFGPDGHAPTNTIETAAISPDGDAAASQSAVFAATDRPAARRVRIKPDPHRKE